MVGAESDGRPAQAAVEIQPLHESDLNEVLAIERETYPVPWGLACFRNELSRPYSYLVGLFERQTVHLLGYVCFWILYNEMHILNLAVRPGQRGRGFGRRLLAHGLELGRSREATLVTLEVRVSNSVAINLYRSMGFRKVGVRPHYYSPEREDALLMQLDLGG
ncbi:MAG: ribosomal protein S18-alanine N-acetyltransferase [Pseudomonadota bacterium]